ncbi:type II toxin-antitoxin system VapC family toxin [Xanthobacter sp. KR7-225]|uniref:type II toxin-antitoxin system VapC family toxin n=1 Tax=Xanthobacter sp. KR7-225 TaxID=3156613 RepID=UPI0032B57751
MSEAVVVDASIAVKWFVKEDDAQDAFRLLKGAKEIRAPQLLFGEVANALWKKVRRGDLTPDVGVGALEVLPGYISTVIVAEDLMGRALRLACAVHHPVYDCLYVEGARHVELPLVTADARLIRKFSSSPYASFILPLSDWRP